MGWISIEGDEIKENNLNLIYSEIKEERRFWFDKCMSYMNFYFTINISIFTAYFLGNYFDAIKEVLILLPIMSIIICYYARKVNRICHNQFIENTIIMIKIEYLLGIYNSIYFNSCNGQVPFCNDKYLGMERHYKNMINYDKSEDYIKIELNENKRTYSYNNKALLYMIIISIILIIYNLISVYKLDDIIMESIKSIRK